MCFEVVQFILKCSSDRLCRALQQFNHTLSSGKYNDLINNVNSD